METTQKFINTEENNLPLNEVNAYNGEDKTISHLKFTNLRLDNCKLREEIRKLKSQSKYSSVFDDYDLEMKTLHKLLESMGNDNKLLSIKNIQLKHDLNNIKLSACENKSAELKTVRSLQRTLRETTKKLKEREVELTKLTSDI